MLLCHNRVLTAPLSPQLSKSSQVGPSLARANFDSYLNICPLKQQFQQNVGKLTQKKGIIQKLVCVVSSETVPGPKLAAHGTLAQLPVMV